MRPKTKGLSERLTSAHSPKSNTVVEAGTTTPGTFDAFKVSACRQFGGMVRIRSYHAVDIVQKEHSCSVPALVLTTVSGSLLF